MVNPPVNASETCTQVPKIPSCEEASLVKLKKELSFKGHMYFEPIRPHKVKAAPEYLQRVNPLCYFIIRDYENNEDLLAIGNNLPDNDIDFDVESEKELECTTNPLNAHRYSTNQSLVINNKNWLELAPGKGRETRHILFDEKCEELPFPKTFFKERLEYIFPHKHYLTPTKY